MNMVTNMKQYLWILFSRYHLAACVVFISLFISVIGNAQDNEYTIQVDFFFDTQAIPGRTVVGYRLYMDDESICEVGPVDPQAITCSLIADAGTYEFSLSAIYNLGAESRPSNKFTFKIGDIIVQLGDINGDGFIDLKDIIIGLQVLTNSYSGNLTPEADVNGDNKIGLEEILFDLNKTSLN
jgi:hypothetical protein